MARLDFVRIVNAPDIVPNLPPRSSASLNKHAATLQFLRNVQPSLSCWHALATYLSLIDPTLQPIRIVACWRRLP
jgi:hypothetical protein